VLVGERSIRARKPPHGAAEVPRSEKVKLQSGLVISEFAGTTRSTAKIVQGDGQPGCVQGLRVGDGLVQGVRRTSMPPMRVCA
jgi:hypothetical protein